MPKVSLLTLRTSPELAAEVVAYYLRERILEVSGASAAYLLQDDVEPGKLVVVAHWDREDGYTAWQNAPARARFTQEIAALTDGAVTASNSELKVLHQS